MNKRNLLSNTGTRTPWRFSMACFALIFCLAAFIATPALAAEPEDDFLSIVEKIHEGDTLSAAGKTDPALSKYKQAQAELVAFRKSWPTWNIKMVNYRLSYLQDKITPPAPMPGLTPSGSEEKSATKADNRMKLLEPGAEPRRELRFKPQAGDKQVLKTTVKMATETLIGDKPMPAFKMPAITMPMELTITGVAENGDISYDLTLAEPAIEEEPGSSPEMQKAMKSALAGLKGVTGSGKMSSRGASISFNFKSSGNDAQSKQMLGHMHDSMANISLMLPDQPVGQGAKWEINQPVKSQGISITQVATYELISLEDDQLTLKSTVKQSAGRQKAQLPNMAGAQAEVVKMSGSGSGEITANLNHAFPSKALANMKSEAELNIAAGGQNRGLQVKTDLQMTVDSE
jgi:hypothetical protein